MEQTQPYGGQVYYDAKTGQYYTQNRPLYSNIGYAFPSAQKTYLNQSPFSSTNNQSQIQQMLANRQPYQYNAPNAQQMFSNMGSPLQGMFPGQGRPFMGTMPTQAQGSPMLGGSFGAGRFLGGNQAGLLGTSVSGT